MDCLDEVRPSRGVAARVPGQTLKDTAQVEPSRNATQRALQYVQYVLEFMPRPALLLGARGRIVHANLAAAALLREGDALFVDHDSRLHVTTVLPAESRALSRYLAAVLSVGPTPEIHVHGPVRLSRPSGRAPLLILAAPLLPAPFVPDGGADDPLALTLIIDPEPQLRNVAAVLQAAAGLTPAESRVAALVGGGFGGPQAAAFLKVSRPTMRTHLASCFEKLGVRSQVGLARLLSGLPETLLPTPVDPAGSHGNVRRTPQTTQVEGTSPARDRKTAALCSTLGPARLSPCPRC